MIIVSLFELFRHYAGMPISASWVPAPAPNLFLGLPQLPLGVVHWGLRGEMTEVVVIASPPDSRPWFPPIFNLRSPNSDGCSSFRRFPIAVAAPDSHRTAENRNRKANRRSEFGDRRLKIGGVMSRRIQGTAEKLAQSFMERS